MATPMTHEDRLQWLLKFAYADLDSLRPGDWLNLRADLREFFGRSVYPLPPGVSPQAYDRVIALPGASAVTVMGSTEALAFVAEAKEGWFKKLRESVCGLLASRVLGKPILTVEFPPAYYLLGDARGWTILCLKSTSGEKTAEREILFVGALALAESDSSRIQPCPSCDRLFWRAGRRRFCSPKCRAKENYQAWLVRQAQKDEGARRKGGRRRAK